MTRNEEPIETPRETFERFPFLFFRLETEILIIFSLFAN